MPHFEKDSQLEKVNFRPVTVLSEVSRIFERILHHQLADHFENIFHNYSRLPITRTLKGNWKQVRFNGSLKQITGSKEISKWIGWGGRNAIKQQSIQGWTLNLNWSDKKVKMKNWLGCFEINSMFRTSVHGFLPDSSRVYNMARVIEGKIVWKWSERKKNYFEFAGGSSYRGFELPKVRVSKCNSKCKKEIQGKSTSVRVSARFELSRVSCTCSGTENITIVLQHFSHLLIEQWEKDLDKHNITGMIAIDLSKAFECLSHNRILEKLKVLGLSEHALSPLVIKRYKLSDAFSTWQEVSRGVLQGSILGPSF